MNPSPSSEQPHDELPLPYRIAVQTILDEPVANIELRRLVPSARIAVPVAPPRRRGITRKSVWSVVAAAAVLVVSAVVLWPTDAWSDVVAKMRKQTWVRLTATDPKSDANAQIWISPAKRIAAGRFPNSAAFLEFDLNKRQRYDQKTKTIVVSDADAFEQDEFAAFAAVLESFGGKDELLKTQLGAMKIVGTSRDEKRAGDKRWTEFAFDCEDARRSPPQFRRIFHVPDDTQLPAKMIEEWKFNDKADSRSYVIDYPVTGPEDLYALDVPKDAKVIDTTSGKELKSVLAEYAKQQQAPFDHYKATLITTVQDWKSLCDVYRVRFDDKGYNTDAVDSEQLFKFQMTLAGNGPNPDDVERLVADLKKLPKDADPVAFKLLESLPERAGRILWWKVEADKMGFNPHGSANQDAFNAPQSICPNLAGYPGLGFPNEGMRAILNPKPSVGPADTVMLTMQDARSGKTLWRYWLAPERGWMCVRSEMTPEKSEDWMDTTIVDAAETSPKGRWYATQIRRGRVEQSGDDLRAESGVAPVATVVFRYLVEFAK